MANVKTPRIPRKQVTPKPISSVEAGNGSSIDLESEIRRRAYELYELRGCAPGHEDEDWLVAEREIKARFNQLASGARA